MTTLTVGTGLQYTTLSAAIAAARPGDTIGLQAGTYTNDFPGLVNGLTIEGVGGIAKLVATAQPGNGKAILDVAGNTTLRNLDISGVTVPDANGAAIRYESGNLVIENTAIHGNQNGILGASDRNGSTAIDKSEIYGNGTSTGSTHNIYIGDIATFTLTNSYIHDANTGHEVKSRAETNVITNNRIEDNGSTASYEIDLPNGGNATISGNTIQKSANSGNHVVIAYGEEGSTHAGTTVSITNNVIISDQPGAYAVWDTTDAPITASGNTIYNVSQIDKAGHVSSSGFATLASRPALDTSSPITTPGTTGLTIPSTPATPTPPAPPADKTAPLLTVTESVSGTTKITSNTLSGTVSDSGSGVASVEVYLASAGKRTGLGQATLNGNTWTYTVDNLAPGTYDFTAVGIDKAGNATTPISAGPSQTVVAAVAVPPPAPSAPILSAPAQNGLQSVSKADPALYFKGTAAPGSYIIVNDVTSNGRALFVGSAITGNDGKWTATVENLDTRAVNTLTALLYDGKGITPVGPSMVLSSTASETLSGTAGKSDLFAFLPSFGKDIVRGFETTSAVGAAHDLIDLAGSSFQTFQQLQSHISGNTSAVIQVNSSNAITLTGVSANSLQASDFRFA